MTAKVFVGNFSFNVDDEQLKAYFSEVGSVVSAKVMTEGQGGRSRGFGFVEMSSKDDAEKAIKDLDGQVWEGRVIKVCEDRSSRSGGRDDSSRGDYRGGGNRGSYQDAGDRQAPIGYFRAQPLDIGVRKRRKSDPYLGDEDLAIDYKDAKMLSRFISERARILPRRMTGLTSRNQRLVTRAIKRAQHLALLPYPRN